MRTRHTPGRMRTDGGAGTPPPPDLRTPTDEGPMRRELLRQIAHLEAQLSRFTRDNTPFEPMPAVKRRGPAVLPTAALEDIRDELLALRTALHDRVVDRVRDRLVDEPAPRPAGRRRLLRRRRPAR